MKSGFPEKSMLDLPVLQKLHKVLQSVGFEGGVLYGNKSTISSTELEKNLQKFEEVLTQICNDRGGRWSRATSVAC